MPNFSQCALISASLARCVDAVALRILGCIFIAFYLVCKEFALREIRRGFQSRNNRCYVSTAASAPSGAEVCVFEDVGCTVGSGFVGEAALFGVALLDCVDLGISVIDQPSLYIGWSGWSPIYSMPNFSQCALIAASPSARDVADALRIRGCIFIAFLP